MSNWIDILLQGDPGLSRHSIGGVPAAPVAIGFEIAVGIMGEQAVAVLVNQPCLDLGGNAVPVAINCRRKRARACPGCSQLALAQITRDGFDVAPSCLHGFTITTNAPQHDRLIQLLGQIGLDRGAALTIATMRIEDTFDLVTNHNRVIAQPPATLGVFAATRAPGPDRRAVVSWS